MNIGRAEECRLREVGLKAQDDKSDDERTVRPVDRASENQIEDLAREQEERSRQMACTPTIPFRSGSRCSRWR